MGAAVSAVSVARIVVPLVGAAVAATAAAAVIIAEALGLPVIHQPGFVNQEECEKLKEEGKKEYLEQKKRERDQYPLPEFLDGYVEGRQMNIAVIGESGVGKSSLVNVILGCDVADVGGISETTEEPQPYEHPISKEVDGHVHLWDLPGAGTQNFPLETYIQRMGMRYFDAAIVVLHNRVKEANVEIIKELQKYSIPCVCVVNKMDAIVDDAKEDTVPRTLEETFQLVSVLYKSKFAKAGCDDVNLFRLSTRALKRNRGSVQSLAKDPLNCDWEPFKTALVYAVCLARGYSHTGVRIPSWRLRGKSVSWEL